MAEPGALVVIGTPIGNLGDLSARAAEELGRADAIACEDTRRTGRLLSLSGIAAPRLLMANEYSEEARVEEIIDRLGSGQRVALVSDAGMPTVSDPGRRIVDAVSGAGFAVEVVPGPVAAVAALAASGFAADRFVFEGFLPRKGTARKTRITDLALERRTIVLYEAPPRLARTLQDLADACGGDRRAVVARELTKLYEQYVRGPLDELVETFSTTPAKGELVVVIEGASGERAAVDDDALRDALNAALERGVSRRDAVAEVVAATAEPKRRVYDLATRLDEHEADDG